MSIKSPLHVFSSTGQHRVLPGIALFVLLLLLPAGSSFADSATYAYDALGRLTSVTYSNGVVITYAYDAAGNRSSYVVTGAP